MTGQDHLEVKAEADLAIDSPVCVCVVRGVCVCVCAGVGVSVSASVSVCLVSVAYITTYIIYVLY